jgi:acetyltransferase-like isoleucine patch superfamily enzyme
MIYRSFWILRAIAYKPFFKKFSFPSYLGKPIYLKGTTKISLGKRVRIYPNARMEVHGKDAEIIIEDNVGIGQNFHIISGGKLKIGTGTTIAPSVFVNNMDHNYQSIGVSVLKQKNIVHKTTIGKNCFIGYGAVIQAGTILGEQCIVGAGAIVKGKFDDFSVIVGNPAKVIKQYDKKTRQWIRINNDKK